MQTNDFIIALRNDISEGLKKEILAELLASLESSVEKALNNNVFNLKQASSYLKISVFTLRRMISRDEIPHYKLGNQYFIRQESLHKWILLKEDEPKNTIKKKRPTR